MGCVAIYGFISIFKYENENELKGIFGNLKCIPIPIKWKSSHFCVVVGKWTFLTPKAIILSLVVHITSYLFLILFSLSHTQRKEAIDGEDMAKLKPPAFNI